MPTPPTLNIIASCANTVVSTSDDAAFKTAFTARLLADLRQAGYTVTTMELDGVSVL